MHTGFTGDSPSVWVSKGVKFRVEAEDHLGTLVSVCNVHAGRQGLEGYGCFAVCRVGL